MLMKTNMEDKRIKHQFEEDNQKFIKLKVSKNIINALIVEQFQIRYVLNKIEKYLMVH